MVCVCVSPFFSLEAVENRWKSFCFAAKSGAAQGQFYSVGVVELAENLVGGFVQVLERGAVAKRRICVPKVKFSVLDSSRIAGPMTPWRAAAKMGCCFWAEITDTKNSIKEKTYSGEKRPSAKKHIPITHIIKLYIKKKKDSQSYVFFLSVYHQLFLLVPSKYFQVLFICPYSTNSQIITSFFLHMQKI